MKPAIEDRSLRPRTDLAVSADEPVLCLHNTQNRPLQTAYEFHFPLEIGLILHGRMRRVFPNHEAVLGPGQVWLCGMWEPHGYQVVSRPCRRVVLMIHPPMLAETRFAECAARNWLLPFTVPPHARPRAKTPRQREEMLRLGQRMKEALGETGDSGRARLRLFVWELLLSLTRDWSPPRAGRALEPGSFARVSRAIAAVFSSKRRVGVAEVSRLCGLSRNRFSDLFRSWAGIAFPQFALRFRLSGAANELAITQEPIKAIATEWGFVDDCHFHRAFARHYGVSPSQYRSQSLRGEEAR